MSKEWEPPDIFAVLGCEYARDVLVAATDGPFSAREIAERCDASLPTVYRRIDVLEEYGFLAEHNEVREDGTHHSTFETRLDRITLHVEDDHIDVEPAFTSRLGEKFSAFWRDMERSGDAADRLHTSGHDIDDGTSSAGHGPGDAEGGTDG
jgi:predicted ArsR family transcriptional regulator